MFIIRSTLNIFHFDSSQGKKLLKLLTGYNRYFPDVCQPDSRMYVISGGCCAAVVTVQLQFFCPCLSQLLELLPCLPCSCYTTGVSSSFFQLWEVLKNGMHLFERLKIHGSLLLL